MAPGQDFAFSPLTRVVRELFDLARWITPQAWLGYVFPILRLRHKLRPDEIADIEFSRLRARAIDNYIIGWFCLEIGCFAALGILQGPVAWFRWLATVVATLRIIEIVQLAVNTAVLDQTWTRADRQVANAVRYLVHAFVNVGELVLCFAIIYAVRLDALANAKSVVDALYFSVVTQFTIGYGDLLPTGTLRGVVVVQAIAAFIMSVLIISRAITVLPPMKELLVDSNDVAAPVGEA
jgi:hypothetical protein